MEKPKATIGDLIIANVNESYYEQAIEDITEDFLKL